MYPHRHRFCGDEAKRRKWQNPEAILADVGLHRSMTFIDIGCGEGFFTIPAAKIVSSEGSVYALDHDEEAIALLRERAARENIHSIVLEVGFAEDWVVCGCGFLRYRAP